jgi:sterol desaturase/sphingolipid hydroxylase (fatty acid hydroxylase superfamily)
VPGVTDLLSPFFSHIQDLVFENTVEPLIHLLQLDNWLEIAFDGVEFFLFGILEVLALYLVLRPLEALRPAEKWSSREGVGTDVIYTLLHRLGVVPLLFFIAIQPLADSIDAMLRFNGFIPFTLEGLFPFLINRPIATFIAYLIVLDFAAYWQHRLQHRLEWWWALHALHHSQQRMSLWTDDRNHLIDDVLGASWFAGIALVIGVPPSQFLLLALLTRFLQSLAHANIKLSFGQWGDCLLVSPHFHRVHHAIDLGHQGALQGCNFAVLFPIWDILFNSARFIPYEGPTGIFDQRNGRDYGHSFWGQQKRGVQRLLQVLTHSLQK